MGYWKKPRKFHCKKECKPYIQLFSLAPQSVGTGGVVKFDECGPECGFEQCRNDLIVQHEGVYFVSFQTTGDTDLVITVNGVEQVNTELGSGLLCLKCGDKIRVIATGEGVTTIGDVNLILFKVG